MQVPVESIKIQTVEKIVEVPVEVIKYVNKVTEVGNQEEVEDLKRQLQEQVKSKQNIAQENRIVIKE